MPSTSVNGVERIRSRHGFVETIANLEGILQAKGLQVFAKIDFSEDAARHGMQMPPTRALLFGNPEAGTPVMLASPSAAIDLPLKILIAEDRDKHVWLSFNAPEYLAERHGIKPELVSSIAGIRKIAEAAAG